MEYSTDLSKFLCMLVVQTFPKIFKKAILISHRYYKTGVSLSDLFEVLSKRKRSQVIQNLNVIEKCLLTHLIHLKCLFCSQSFNNLINIPKIVQHLKRKPIIFYHTFLMFLNSIISSNSIYKVINLHTFPSFDRSVTSNDYKLV